MENVDIPNEKKAKKFNFKEYANANPEFKAKHNCKQNEKVLCECGRTVCRGNLSTHRKSKVHCKPFIKDDDTKLDSVLQQLNELKELILKEK